MNFPNSNTLNLLLQKTIFFHDKKTLVRGESLICLKIIMSGPLFCILLLYKTVIYKHS